MKAMCLFEKREQPASFINVRKGGEVHLNPSNLIKQHVVDPVNHFASRQNPAMASEPEDGPWYDRQWTAMTSSKALLWP